MFEAPDSSKDFQGGEIPPNAAAPSENQTLEDLSRETLSMEICRTLDSLRKMSIFLASDPRTFSDCCS